MALQTTSRNRILDAAEQVVMKRGAMHMTFESVAARAKLSKGGVLYHFPSLRHLLDAMIKRLIEHVETRAAATAATLPPGPAREIKANMLAWFTLGKEHRSLATSVLAAISRNPSLLATIRERRGAKLSALLERVHNPEQIILILLAVEGLWLSELMGIDAYPQKQRTQIFNKLMKMADEACSPPATTRKRKPERRSS